MGRHFTALTATPSGLFSNPPKINAFAAALTPGALFFFRQTSVSLTNVGAISRDDRSTPDISITGVRRVGNNHRYMIRSYKRSRLYRASDGFRRLIRHDRQ